MKGKGGCWTIRVSPLGPYRGQRDNVRMQGMDDTPYTPYSSSIKRYIMVTDVAKEAFKGQRS